MKTRVQAQHLQPGDIVGSGEEVVRVHINSTQWPSNKVCVALIRGKNNSFINRSVLWGKYTEIGVERAEANV